MNCEYCFGGSFVQYRRFSDTFLNLCFERQHTLYMMINGDAMLIIKTIVNMHDILRIILNARI